MSLVYFIWTDAPAQVAADFPGATELRPDRLEPGVVVMHLHTVEAKGPGLLQALTRSPYVRHWQSYLHEPQQPVAPPHAVTWQADQWVVIDDGSLQLHKAPVDGWEEPDDLQTVHVFDTREGAETLLHARSAFYRVQEEPPDDEDHDEDHDEADDA